MWRKRAESQRSKDDRVLMKRISLIHRNSLKTYGAPRVHQELKKQGFRVGRKRVARLMKAGNLRGVTRRRFSTTRRDGSRPAPDLVQRKFVATQPDQLWVADITQIPVLSGTLYLAIVLDVYSRRVVGWSMKRHMESSLVLSALKMATEQRNPQNVIHHSDQGSQYTSFAFSAACRERGIKVSMGSVGDCYDNALAESFFATIKCELVHRNPISSYQQTSKDIFKYIEGWYNRRRAHSSLNYLSPVAFEEAEEQKTKTVSAKTG